MVPNFWAILTVDRSLIFIPEDLSICCLSKKSWPIFCSRSLYKMGIGLFGHTAFIFNNASYKNPHLPWWWFKNIVNDSGLVRNIHLSLLFLLLQNLLIENKDKYYAKYYSGGGGGDDLHEKKWRYRKKIKRREGKKLA